MPTHKKALPKVMRKRRRHAKRQKLLKKGINPDDLFKNGIYVKEWKKKE